MTIFRGTHLASISSLLFFAACSGQKTAEVSLVLEESPGGLQTLNSGAIGSNFTPIVSSSGLITNRSCYMVHVTAPDLIVKGTEGGGGGDDNNNDDDGGDSQCASDAPEVPGLGLIFGPFAYNSTAKISVPAGSGRRFDLIGFINPYDKDPNCSKGFSTKVGPGGRVNFSYGEYIVNYESPVSGLKKAEDPFAKLHFFSVSNSVNLSPGPQTVNLRKVAWNAQTGRPQPYAGGCGDNDRDVVFPYMHKKVIRTAMNPGFLDFKCVAGTSVRLEVKGSAVAPVLFPDTGTLACPTSERIVFSNISLDPTAAQTGISNGWTRKFYEFKFFGSAATPLVEGQIELSPKYQTVSHYTGSSYNSLQFNHSSLLGIHASGIVLKNAASSDTNLVAPFPNVSGSILAAVSDGSGGWYIGGNFLQVGSFPRMNIARVNADGSVDANWKADVYGSVHALALQGSKLFVGGVFTKVGTNAGVKNLVTLDASTGMLKEWNDDIDGSVDALALNDDGATLFAGGSIGISSGANLASFDSDDLAFTNTLTTKYVDGSVHALISVGSALYVGGTFFYVNGSPRQNLASIDFSSGTGDWTAWSPSANNSVVAFAYSSISNKLYVGGMFTDIANYARKSIVAFDVSNGALDTAWNPNLDCAGSQCRVSGIAFDSTRVYLAGDFDTLNGQARKNIGAVDSATGALTEAWSPSVISTTGFSAIALSESKLYTWGINLEVGNTVPAGKTISPKKLGFAGYKSSSTSRELYLQRDYMLTDIAAGTSVNKNELNKFSIVSKDRDHNKGAFEWNGDLTSLNSNLLSAAGSYIENVIVSKLSGVLEFFGLSHLGSFDMFRTNGSTVYRGPSDNSVSGRYPGQDYFSTHDSGVHAIVSRKPSNYTLTSDATGKITWPGHPFSTGSKSFEVAFEATCMKAGTATPIEIETQLWTNSSNSNQFELKDDGQIISGCTLELKGQPEAFIFVPTGTTTSPNKLEGIPISLNLPTDVQTVKSLNLHVSGDNVILAVLYETSAATSEFFTTKCSILTGTCGTANIPTAAAAGRTAASFIATESDGLFYVVGGTDSTVHRYLVDTDDATLNPASDNGVLYGTAGGSVSLIRNLRDSNNGIDVPGEAMLLKGSSHHTAYRTRDAGLTWYAVFSPQPAGLLLDILPVHLDNGDSEMEPGFILLEKSFDQYSITSQWGDGF